MPLKKRGVKLVRYEDSADAPKKPVDLRSIMDYTRDFALFFSGVESETYFKGVYDMGVRDFLMSYHYLQNSRIPMTKRYGGLGIKFFIDSGAFTYHNDPKYQNRTIEEWEEHIQRYLKWAEKNREFIFCIANCDFELFIDGEIVKSWNENYFEPFMLRTGIPVCFVHHEESAMTWEQYCQRYPYVGFSAATIDGVYDFSTLHSRIQTAAKYNTLVHGFGMTRTSLLPKLPYYTVDSTSWKAGFMYGQLAFWNGKKVQMLRKDEFDRAFKYIRMYKLEPPIDEKLIYDYYEPEVLRANVYAYMMAIEFIRNSLKPLTYWKKAKAIVRKDVSEVRFPPVEWFKKPREERDDWLEYAVGMNISTEDRKEALDFISHMTAFLHWQDPEYEYVWEIYKDEDIKILHDLLVNRPVEDNETRIQDLRDFFTANALGENTTLLYWGTNFDRTVKEREHYIEEDDEFDYEDVSPMELRNVMSNALPPYKEGEHAPEITELDDEIFNNVGIIPIRDEKGRFLKGQRAVKRPKKLYSDKYPKMSCDRCVNAQTCQEYKPGYVCAYDKMFQRFHSRRAEDVIQAIQGITDFSLQRLQRGMISEVLNGGIPDGNVSAMMNQTAAFLERLNRMYELQNLEMLRQTKVLSPDGTQTITTSVSNPREGGILTQIFGGMTASSQNANVSDAPEDESQ